ncbi:MAG: hypothetical protein FLDDKLPJ_03581 [Phycisphaerae bacterium]|nr:hypothetical protein [Phycisphaerae bacterium]
MLTTRSTLIERVRRLDDVGGWAEFDRLYRPLLTRYARQRGLSGPDAEDVAQESLEVVFRRIQDFKKRKSFRGWLRRIVENKVMHQMTRLRRAARGGGDAAIDLACASGGTPAEIWERHWNQTHLLYCLSTLREDFAEHTLRSFEMYVLQQRPVDEICRTLGMTRNHVYVAKNRIMRRLRERFEALMSSLYGGEA